MSILVDEEKRILQLNTEKSTYQMEVNGIGTLFHTYYGERLNCLERLDYSIFGRPRGHAQCPPEVCDPEIAKNPNISCTMEVQPQEMSAFGLGDFRTTGIRVRQANGTRSLQLRFAGYKIYQEKYAIPELPSSYDENGDCQTLEVQLVDIPTKTVVRLLFGVFEKANVITRATIIENGAKETMCVEKCASAHVDFTTGDFDMIDFYGSWGRERYAERRPLTHGMQSIGSVRGESSALFNPSMILADHMATETKGNAYGFAFVYSGSHLIEVEKSVDDQVRVIIGIHPDDFSWQLKPGEKFFAPEVVMTYSGEGISGVSRTFHDFVRTSITRGPWRDKKRPVLLNSWEGVYFKFDGEKLIRMAKEAAECGVELFVLDDGWFGKRDDAKSGLGDWYPNEKKLGMTLKELGDRVREAGTQFGIWFEPEMISKDSDLYRAHPDWAIAIPGRAPHLGRTQLLLDVSRREVQDYLIDAMSKVIREAGLTYIKWDANRCMCDRYSAELPPERQGELMHRQYIGVYRILESLLREFPDLLIEGCASGGARFDMGMLCYEPQIWTSDDTDAVERLMIQHGTSMIYPVRTMGAHVSAVPNHQTGRTTPMKTRATVALSGTFGYELDVNNLTQEEKAEMKLEIEQYHRFYDLIQFGDYYRLISPTSDTCTIWEHVKKDGTEALVSIVFHHVRPCPIAQRFYVQGLKDDAMYRLQLLRTDDLWRMNPSYSEGVYSGKTVLSGKALRLIGVNAPFVDKNKDLDYNSWQLLITEEK